MKTTIKLDLSKALVIEPEGRSVRMALRLGAVTVGSVALDPDKVGALLFAVEQAADAAQIASEAVR